MVDISERLAVCYTASSTTSCARWASVISRCPSELRPILPEQAMAGPAFTIEGSVVEGANAHETLLAWTGLLAGAGRLHLDLPAE